MCVPGVKGRNLATLDDPHNISSPSPAPPQVVSAVTVPDPDALQTLAHLDVLYAPVPAALALPGVRERLGDEPSQ